MENFDEIKQLWNTSSQGIAPTLSLKNEWLLQVKQRARKTLNTGLQFFWASFIYQMIIYALLAHILIKYHQDTTTLWVSFICLLLYIPFLIVLLKKYKAMAVAETKNIRTGNVSMKEYILEQYKLLSRFFRFKVWYETILVPLSSAYFVWIFFRLYIPGGLKSYPIAAGVFFLCILTACTLAIFLENKRNFKKPLKEFEEILLDLNREPGEEL